MLWLTGVEIRGQGRTVGLATLLALVVAGICWFGFGLSARADVESEPLLAFRPPVSPAAPGSTEPPITEKSRAPTDAASAVASPRFVWVPEPGAVGYRVALYRDEQLVFEQDVRKPTLVLPSTWAHDERIHRLTRGPYRWVVWALVRNGDSLHRGRAIVSARYVAS